MTRKSIEERLKLEMHQNIPDKDALWQKIEANLPEQNIQPVRKTIRMTAGTKFLTAAACFLIIIAGISYLRPQKLAENQSAEAPAQDNCSSVADDSCADADNDNDIQPEQNSGKELLSYENLNISHETAIASRVNLSLLGTQDEYFSEEDILNKTEFFIDVRVLDGFQEDSGIMHYTLEILDVYGSELNQKEITLESRSAYILEQNHEYVLPVFLKEKQYVLSCECAPQIEKTLDNRLLIPNGWHTLMQDDAEPVLYDSFGKDDYFYDRMYLTGNFNLNLLIQKWESL